MPNAYILILVYLTFVKLNSDSIDKLNIAFLILNEVMIFLPSAKEWSGKKARGF